MRNPRLEPVRITDRNGRHTTVYRRATTGTTTAKALPSPTAPAPAEQVRRREVHYKISGWVAEMIEGGSPDGTAPDRTGSAILTDDDMFAYLTLGTKMAWAAAMHSVHPDPVHWARTQEAQHLAGFLTLRRDAPPMAASVEMMRGLGHAPEEVEIMLANGLNDEHLRGVLTPEQTATVFTKVSCAPMKSKVEDGVQLMARCLTDGTIPVALVEDGAFDRETFKALARLDNDSRAAEASGLVDNPAHGFHTAAKADPGLWRTMAELIEMREGNRTRTGRVWRALRDYGEGDCRRFGPHTLLIKTDTGATLGDLIREARALGMGDDAIEAALRAHGDRPSAVLAIARGETAPAVSDGWL